MNRWIVFALLLVVVGCGGAEQSITANDQIRDWQAREQACEPIRTECQYSGDLWDDIEATLAQAPQFDIDRIGADDLQYWNASCESFAKPIGTCADSASYAYGILSASCLVDLYDLDVRLRIVQKSTDETHMVAVAYFGTDVYEVSNMHLQVESDYPVVVEYDAFTLF